MPKALREKFKRELQALANSQKAKFLQRYFKTGEGEYGEGDVFLGVTVPQTRIVAKKYFAMSLEELAQLLRSVIHEERLAALLILVGQFKKADKEKQTCVFDLYVNHRKWINNWDLIDFSAPDIVGAYLQDKDKKILTTLARSKSIWDRRIAILTTHYFIKQGKANDALHIAQILVDDEHDLIHKAVGWMLREIGNYCGQDIEELFLKRYYKTMPRTMLRYAIEHFSKEKRVAYLKGRV